MDDFLNLENRRTREILRMRRVRDAQGQIVFIVPEGSLPAGADGPPLHVHFQEHEEIVVKAGTLGAQVGTQKITVPAGGPQFYPQAFLIAGGTRATICWRLAATQFPQWTWIASSRRCLLF